MTGDGSPTLIDPVSGDSYHSMRGAIGESEYVFIENGFRYVVRGGGRLAATVHEPPAAPTSELSERDDTQAPEPLGQYVPFELPAAPASEPPKWLGIPVPAPAFERPERSAAPPEPPATTPTSEPRAVSILEVGFGSGLNALLTAVEAERSGVRVDYTAVEKYPVDAKTAAAIDYGHAGLFKGLHAAEWERAVQVTDLFRLRKCATALQDFDTVATFDLVYFDAFAYDTQPEMWSGEVFAKLASMMPAGAVLVTYSAKGVVKRNLRAAGFEVKRLPGALGKRHMLRAVKI